MKKEENFMGLTSTSTGSRLLVNSLKEQNKKCDYTIALAGNPNVGKSTIFNALTGMHQHTGNWPGKTVSNATGICSFEKKNFLLVDIPGTYSLMSNSQEEEIARDYICFGNPNVTVVIVDATCLERNLNLVYQTMEITKNVVVCVNLLDEAKKKKIQIDLEKLSDYLGVPVVGTSAKKPKTLHKLLSTIYKVCLNPATIQPVQVQYFPIIETCIQKLMPIVANIIPPTKEYLYRWICLKLIENNPSIVSSIEQNLCVVLQNAVKLQSAQLEIQEILANNSIDNNTLKDTLVSSIVFKAEDVCNDVVVFMNARYQLCDRKIDKILTSKTFGIPIMIAFLGIVFWITITGANYPSQLLSNFFGFIQEELVCLFEYFHAPNWLTGILIYGMYQTLAWVVAVMLPPMAIFFPIFTLLEDLGYLPRIAFNLDYYFKKACATGKQALTMCMGVTKRDFFIISPS